MPSRKSASIVPFQRLPCYRSRGWGTSWESEGLIKRRREGKKRGKKPGGEKERGARGEHKHSELPTGADVNFLHPRVDHGLLGGGCAVGMLRGGLVAGGGGGRRGGGGHGQLWGFT